MLLVPSNLRNFSGVKSELSYDLSVILKIHLKSGSKLNYEVNDYRFWPVLEILPINSRTHA